ncbi:MAG: MotA/TolQ/ExbB proton channel family protein [Gammaproteobacteria bacterium]|nr:MotA/TolQ/ExbB proton channel family protein [Gammaproteobacteria bacterium]
MLSALTSDSIVTWTLYVLVAFSITTWTVVFIKVFQHTRAEISNRRYTRAFWAAPSLAAAMDQQNVAGPAARIARAGFEVLRDQSEGTDLAHSGERRELLERCLRQQLQKERRALDGGLALLASIGSTSPFVGLFGTVWGIMHALKDITKAGSATLDVVAGPIGDALIATAIGIAVAVPAVLAYNFFLRRMKSVVADLDDFATDFLNLAAKSAWRPGVR